MITTINEWKSINEKRWKYRINIKQYLTNELLTDESQIIELVNNVKNKLSILKNKMNDENTSYELDEIIDNCEFMISLADGTIKEDDFDNYYFDGDFTEYFNDNIMQVFYDFCDANSIWVE